MPERPSNVTQPVILGLMLGAGLYFVLIIEVGFVLAFGISLLPGPPLSPSRVVLTLAALLPVRPPWRIGSRVTWKSRARGTAGGRPLRRG